MFNNYKKTFSIMDPKTCPICAFPDNYKNFSDVEAIEQKDNICGKCINDLRAIMKNMVIKLKNQKCLLCEKFKGYGSFLHWWNIIEIEDMYFKKNIKKKWNDFYNEISYVEEYCKKCSHVHWIPTEREKLIEEKKNKILNKTKYKSASTPNRIFRKDIFIKKTKKCKICNSKEYLQAHHVGITFLEIKNQYINENEFYDTNTWIEFHDKKAQIITLCKNCHAWYHGFDL